MAYVVAVSGKGGTGKTTVAALLLRQLLDSGTRPVLVVDADPDCSLAPLVGVEAGPTISEIREEVMLEKARTTGVPKERILEMKLEESVVEATGFDLLTMGRPEGQTCYCYVNNLLRGALANMRSNYAVTIVDNEAGMEHLSRMNTDTIDCLVLVSEATAVSARAVKRITSVASKLPVAIRRQVLVWNKVRSWGIPDAAKEVLEGIPFTQVIELPDDETMAEVSALERSVFDIDMPEVFGEVLDACVVRAGAKSEAKG